MALIFMVKVVPSSGRQECILDKSGELKCYLKSQPERGLANKELIGMLSKSLKIPQASIMLLSGDISRKKKIKIEGLDTFEQLMKLLQVAPLDKQEKLFN